MKNTAEWQARVDAAWKPVETYLESTGTPNEVFAELREDFNDNLTKKLGLIESIIGLEGLNDDEKVKFGDYREIMKDVPIVIVRMSWAGLRGAKKDISVHTGKGTEEVDDRTAALRALGLKVRLEDADPMQLFKLYLPDKPSDPVSTALKKRYQDKPVVAFRDDGTVALTETIQYLSDLEQGYPASENVMVDGKLAKLWPVGVRPSTMVEEDPLFPGQPLRNNYSTVNHRNWAKVSLCERQMCRIIVERGDIDPNNQDAVLRLLERAEASSLDVAYPGADLEFRERAKKDTLPKLKVELGALTKPQNPFGVRRQY